ncbi:MAG TPA: ChbG/HpnK family deacetylase, partial [Steroidobacteraceae bacterium]|nr:ChbG/HpnK family deacetylase [Steroidobacteraceae bacterium]
ARAMRVPDEPFWYAARSGHWDAAAGTLLMPWLMLMKHRLRAAGIFHNDSVFGIAGSGCMDEEQLLAILARLPRGVTEIYLHPATASGAAVAPSMGTYRHADELAGLLSARVREAVTALNVRRGGYGDIMRSIGRSLA